MSEEDKNLPGYGKSGTVRTRTTIYGGPKGEPFSGTLPSEIDPEKVRKLEGFGDKTDWAETDVEAIMGEPAKTVPPKDLSEEESAQDASPTQSEAFLKVQEFLQRYDLYSAVIFGMGLMEGDDRTGPEIIKALGDHGDLFRLGHILRTKEKLLGDERDAYALVHDIVKNHPETKELVIKLIGEYEINPGNKKLLLASASAPDLIAKTE